MPAPPPAATELPVQVARHLYLGDVTIDDVADDAAWKTLGFDLDGQIDDLSTTQHCQLHPTAQPAEVKRNGPHGEDNSFGANLWPTIAPVFPGVLADLDDDIAQGGGSFAIGVPQNGSAPDPWFAPVIGGKLYGSPAPTPTQWDDGTYPWNADASSVLQLSPMVASTHFPNSSLNGLELITTVGDQARIGVHLGFVDYDLPLVLHRARLRVTYAEDGRSSIVQLGGVLDTEQVVTAFQAVAHRISTDLCTGASVDGVADQVRGAADIRLDGTQDPGLPCNGISIGVAAKARAATIGSTVVIPVASDPCVP